MLLWPTARWLQVASVRALGLAPNPRRWSDLGAGFAAAFLMMAALTGLLLALRVVEWRDHVHPMDFVQIATSALVVSLLEEWLFRGAILGLLARSLNRWVALFFTSALFSILHFLKPETAEPHTVNWLAGFALIPGAFAQFRQPGLVLGGFTTLFCVGWILGYTRLKTRSLWMAVGLHAGWVLGVQSFSKATHRLMKVEETLPWFGGDLRVGLGSVAVVLLTGALAWRYLRSAYRTSGCGPLVSR